MYLFTQHESYLHSTKNVLQLQEPFGNVRHVWECVFVVSHENDSLAKPAPLCTRRFICSACCSKCSCFASCMPCLFVQCAIWESNTLHFGSIAFGITIAVRRTNVAPALSELIADYYLFSDYHRPLKLFGAALCLSMHRIRIMWFIGFISIVDDRSTSNKQTHTHIQNTIYYAYYGSVINIRTQF